MEKSPSLPAQKLQPRKPRLIQQRSPVVGLVPATSRPQPLKVRVLKKSQPPLPLKHSEPVRAAKEAALNPVNKDIIKSSKEYSELIPAELDSLSRKTRKFVLHEIAPQMIAVFNGVQDASEVLKETFQQDPGMLEFAAFTDQVLMHGVRTKMVSHVCKILGLDAKEAALVLVQSLNLPQSIVETLLRDILAEDTQRKKELKGVS